MLRLASSKVVSSAVVPNAVRAILSPINIVGSLSAAQNSLYNTPNPYYFSHNFSTHDSKKLSADHLLVKAVKSEIKSKQSSLNKIMPVPPSDFPFTIEDNPSIDTLEMRRVISEEEIFVSVAMPNFIPEDDEDESKFRCCECGSPIPVILYVSVTKKSGKILDFGVTLSADEMDISLMTVIEPNESDDHPKTFFGPHDVDEVAGELQCALREYLETRGIRKSDAMFLYKYMAKKSKRLRFIALEKLKNIVEEENGGIEA